MPSFTANDGINLHYTDEGDGLPVIALAGLTRNGADFDHVAPHLPVRLIRPDYRGRGQSDWADPVTYTIAQEAADVITLMDHLGLEKAAILGTSRGGLNAMGLAMGAKNRLMGIALNDVGPVIDPKGIEFIKDYIGRNPAAKTHEDAAAAMARAFPEFANMPEGRWLEEARKHYTQDADGLHITYDKHLRDAVLAAGEQMMPDLWPFFDAMDGLPLALIWGLNSNLLTAETVAEMQKRRPDMILARVPDRGHIPFLDELEAVASLRKWIGAMQ